jgi:hypothetical protein
LADMHESVADNELRRLGNEGCNVHFSGSPLATSERADGADAKVSQRLPNTVIDLRAHNTRAHRSGRNDTPVLPDQAICSPIRSGLLQSPPGRS